MIRTIVVDDHPLVRTRLRRILRDEKDIEVVGEADGYTELMNCLKTVLPDVLLLDISMPGKNGLEIVEELKQSHPSIKTLIVSTYPEENFSILASRAGACGYVSKDSVAELLVQTIRLVHDRSNPPLSCEQ